MSDELPEGLTAEDVGRHAVNIGLAGTLINLSGKYLVAEERTSTEEEAEAELDEFVGRIIDLGPQVCGGVMLVFASLVTQVGDVEKVQGWFDDQGQHIAAALAEAESRA